MSQQSNDVITQDDLVITVNRNPGWQFSKYNHAVSKGCHGDAFPSSEVIEIMLFDGTLVKIVRKLKQHEEDWHFNGLKVGMQDSYEGAVTQIIGGKDAAE